MANLPLVQPTVNRHRGLGGNWITELDYSANGPSTHACYCPRNGWMGGRDGFHRSWDAKNGLAAFTTGEGPFSEYRDSDILCVNISHANVIHVMLTLKTPVEFHWAGRITSRALIADKDQSRQEILCLPSLQRRGAPSSSQPTNILTHQCHVKRHVQRPSPTPGPGNAGFALQDMLWKHLAASAMAVPKLSAPPWFPVLFPRIPD